LSGNVQDSKFYEKRYHLEERERRRRLVCNGVFIAFTLVLAIGFAQSLFVEAISGYQVYLILIPYAFLSAGSFIAWILYHIYSRRVLRGLRDS